MRLSRNVIWSLSVSLALIVTNSVIGPVLVAQDDLDGDSRAVDQRAATLEDVRAWLEQRAADEEVVRLDRLAAERGDPDAQLQLGRAYIRGRGVPQDLGEGANWIRLAAEQGHADAQQALAVAYTRGVGLPMDLREAERWYRLAAEQGNPTHQVLLGEKYSQGDGVLRDGEEAARWFLRAAEQGDAYAQLLLGYQYSGEGILNDHVLAHMWLNIASANGVELAGIFRDDLELSMTGEEVLRATELARACAASNYQACEP